MKKLYFFLFIGFFIQTNLLIKENPIFLVNSKNLIVLSTNDDYYYVITSNKSFKLKKNSGDIKIINNNIFNIFDYNYFSDNEYNNYLYKYINSENSNKLNFEYYKIIYNSGISKNNINFGIKTCSFNMKPVGSIEKDYELFIYGYSSDRLLFIRKSDNDCVNSIRSIIDGKLSCKLINEENFVCAMIINSKLQVDCFKYYIISFLPKIYVLTPYFNSLSYNSISSFGLYDTDDNYIKLLCEKSSQTIYCEFFKIKLSPPILQNDFNSLGNEKLIFTEPNNFEEKNCYLSKFNSEYLFCCSTTNYIQCYRINFNNFNPIKKFNLLIEGDNSNLNIKNNSNYLTFFFINYYNSKYSVYEYYIYFPTCQNRNYVILNNLNENKPEEQCEKLSNLFIVKTNKYFFEIKNPPDEFGYFTLNNEKLNQKTLINNNEYILDFIVINNNISSIFTKNIKYIVSVEDEEAYKEECQIKITFKICYHSCEKCYFDINESNSLQHNCITCRINYYPSPLNKSNCYSTEEKKINWYFDSSKSEFGICHEECLSCSGPTKFNCLSCNNTFYLDNNICISNNHEGNFPITTEINSVDYSNYQECYQNCKTCLKMGDAKEMNCETCKDNQIKYNKSCYDIDNPSIKSFYEPESNNYYNTSCYQKFRLYIKEDSYECIPLPPEEKGYYISNNVTGVISKCHDNCLSCNNGPIKNDSEYIQSMECIKCKDSNIK